MGHPVRWCEPGAVYESTTKTIRGQYFLRPCVHVRAIVDGVIARALELFPAVRLHYFVFLSNHQHMLASCTDGVSLSPFTGYVNGFIAKGIGRLFGSPGKIWGRRARPVRVLGELAMIERLRYLLSQGCKEGLVATPGEWPGASSYEAFVGDMVTFGTWRFHDLERQARRRGETPGAMEYTETYPIRLAPIPAWEGLSAAALRERHRGLVARVIHETRRMNRALGRRPLGAAAVQAVPRSTVPAAPKRSPAPACHASSPLAREIYKRAYGEVVRAHRTAAAAVRRGERDVHFPHGTFASSRGFVAWPDDVVGAPTPRYRDTLT